MKQNKNTYTSFFFGFLLIFGMGCCKNTIAQGTYLSFSQPVSGGNVTGKIYVPSTVSNFDEVPLVIAMHGDCNNASLFEIVSAMKTTAEQNKFKILYVDGYGYNSACAGTGSNIFNSHFSLGTTHISIVKNHADLTIGAINALLDNPYFLYDHDRVYMMGHSSGALFTSYVATTSNSLRSRIRAFSLINGTMPTADALSLTSLPSQHRKPVLLIGGTADFRYGGWTMGTTPIIGVEALMNKWIQWNGGTGTKTTINNEIYLNANPSDAVTTDIIYNTNLGSLNDKSVVLYRSNNQGHLIPGGFAAGSTVAGSGYNTDDYSASDVMWIFFNNPANKMLDSESDGNAISEEMSVSIFPNPANDEIIVNAEFPSNVLEESMAIRITDLNGRTLKNVLVDLGQTKLDVSDLPSGVYYVNTIIGAFSSVEKLMIQ